MSMNELLRFRATYLRAVAEAWADDRFREALIKHPVKALQDRFEYKWPWSDVCDLRIGDATGQYEWLCDTWVWSSHLPEALTLYVPLDPSAAKIPPEHRAMALADFYNQRTSLFSDDWGKYDPPKQIGAPAAAVIARGEAVDPDPGPPTGGFIPGGRDFSAFKVALVAAMAKAWDDKEFKELLMIDAPKALRTVRDYEMPWDLLISVKDDRQARWDPGSQHEGRNNHSHWHPSHWHFDENNVLQLNLPTKPSDVTSEPLALAMYNATGAQYPFTCCPC